MPDDAPGTAVAIEVQPRYRDLNTGDHVDSVEVLRIIDEARIRLLRFAPPEAGIGTGLLAGVPDGVADLVVGVRADYRREMDLPPMRPFLVDLWVSRIGTTSWDVAAHLRLDPDAPPAVVTVTSVVMLDRAAGTPWPLSPEFRHALERVLGDPPALRGAGGGDHR